MSAAKAVFISRAGADAAFAAEIGRILEEAGYTVTLQQWDFASQNFIQRIHEALTSGAHVVALLSPEYLSSDYCAAEWQNVLAGDPLNKQGRLIPMRILECQPPGLLSGLAYWDLVPIRDNPPLLGDVVRNALLEDRHNTTPLAGPYWRAPRVIIDAEAIRPTPSFTDRAEELRALGAALEEREGIAVVHGLAGTGKSALAREYAWRERERYALIWWLNAADEDGIIDGLVQLGSLIVRGLSEMADRCEAAEQVITTVHSGFSKPVLLIFDNLEDEALLQRWRPRQGAQTLATSRIAAWSDVFNKVPLSTWTLDEGAQYLLRQSGRTDLTEADARDVANALGALPLALAQAAVYLQRTRTVTARSYLERISQYLARSPHGGEYTNAVFATFQTSISQAEVEAPGAAAVLCLASFFAPDAVPEELFHQPKDHYGTLSPTMIEMSLTARDLRSAVEDPINVDEAIGALDRISLIDFSTTARTFTMHRLVQAAARELVRDAAMAWVESAVSAANAAFPTLDEPSTWPRCQRLIAHAQSALEGYAQGVTYASAPAGELAYRCGFYLEHRGSYRAAEGLFRAALILVDGYGGEDPAVAQILDKAVSQILDKLAILLCKTNRYAEAEPLLRRALAINEGSYGRDRPEVLDALNNLATLLLSTDRYTEAEALYRRALAIDEASNGPDHPALAGTLTNLAALMLETKRHAEAEQFQNRAFAIQKTGDVVDDPDLAPLLANKAELLVKTNHLSEAELLYRRALASVENTYGSHHPDVATYLRRLADLLAETDLFTEAEPLYRRALEVDETALSADHPATLTDLSNLAIILARMDRLAEAEQLFRRALAVNEEVYGPVDPKVAAALYNLVNLLANTGREAEAEPLFRRALAIMPPSMR